MKHQLLKSIGSNKFINNVVVVGGGIALAQVISLAFTPFLTRLYGPEAFGIAAAFAAVIRIINPMATLGYSNAIVMPKQEYDAIVIAKLSTLCGLVIFPIITLIVYMGKPQLVEWSGLEKYPNLLYLVPLSLLMTTFLSIASQTAIRQELFKPKARAYVESTLLTNVFKLLGGMSLPNGIILIVLAQLGQAVNFIILITRGSHIQDLNPTKWFGIKGTRKAAILYKDFAIFRMPQSIIRAVAMSMPVVLLTALFGSSEAGQYSLTLLVLGAPVMLLGESVGEVFYPKITRAIQEKTSNSYVLIIKATVYLFIMGLATFGIIILIGDLLLPLVFGAEWLKAGLYSQWVAVWMVAMLAARPAVAAIPVLKLQSVMLVYEILMTGVRFFALHIGAKIADDVFAIAVFSIVNVVGYLTLVIMVLLKAKIKQSKVQSEEIS